jgi:hypothetical protein
MSLLPHDRRLGGVVISVLANGPKDYGFEPGQCDGFLMAIKIRSTPSSRMGSIAGRSHVVRFYCMCPLGINRLNSHFLRPSPTPPERSGSQVRS